MLACTPRSQVLSRALLFCDDPSGSRLSVAASDESSHSAVVWEWRGWDAYERSYVGGEEEKEQEERKEGRKRHGSSSDTSLNLMAAAAESSSGNL